jgi:hypothetical protein
LHPARYHPKRCRGGSITFNLFVMGHQN